MINFNVTIHSQVINYPQEKIIRGWDVFSTFTNVDDNTGIFHVFEMRLGINEFDHRILALLKPWKIEAWTGIRIPAQCIFQAFLAAAWAALKCSHKIYSCTEVFLSFILKK